MTAEETQRILDGDIGWMAEDERALVRELYLRMQMGIYRPTVIVDYDREALTYAPGNVRVTFDRRIRGCHQPQLFSQKICRLFQPFLQTEWSWK